RTSWSRDSRLPASASTLTRIGAPRSRKLHAWRRRHVGHTKAVDGLGDHDLACRDGDAVHTQLEIAPGGLVKTHNAVRFQTKALAQPQRRRPEGDVHVAAEIAHGLEHHP